jgi:hypothetical protein
MSGRTEGFPLFGFRISMVLLISTTFRGDLILKYWLITDNFYLPGRGVAEPPLDRTFGTVRMLS